MDGIRKAALERSPYPHFVVDDLLPPGMVDRADALWPDGPRNPEAPGNFLIYLGTRDARTMRAMSAEQRAFWREVIDLICDGIVPATIARYSEWIADRYPGLRNVEFAALSLMETDRRFVQHGAHTHHWHDPTWLFTNLIYVSDDGNGDRGTDIYRVAANDPVTVAARTRHWLKEPDWRGNPDLALARHVGFRPNRLFSFYETPVSYHGVEPHPPGAGNRRVIRMHLRAPRRWVRRLYGVAQPTYERLRAIDNQGERVRAWLQRDLRQLDGKTGREVPIVPHLHRIRTTANPVLALGQWVLDKVHVRTIA